MTAYAWTARLVRAALGMPAASWDHAYAGVSTDTRSIREGDLFVALAGERFDGHDFLGDARAAGIRGAVVRAGTPRWAGFDWYEVPDTLVAYGQLARARRDAFQGRVVAVTGTNGKTSVKELAAAAIGAAMPVHKSERNLNNLVGVPQTLLALPDSARAAVIECGANLRGELGRMRSIVRPDVAVITNVGAGHLEGFGSLEQVLEEKLSLVAQAPVVIVGTSPPNLPDAARAVAPRVVTVSADGAADWTAEQVALAPDGRPRLRVRGVEVTLTVPGRHQVSNALVAIAVADAVGVSLADAAAGLARAELPAGRTAVREVDGVTLVDDTYNANPVSMAAALDLLQAMRAGRRAVVVVGTMRELGSASDELHAAVAERVLEAKPEVVAAIGAFVPAFEALSGRLGAVKLLCGPTPADVAPALRRELRPGDIALFKASRGVRLEQLFPILWPSLAGGEAH